MIKKHYMSIVWVLIALIGMALTLGAAFSHPEMTGTRLFLEYWPVWLGLISLYLLVAIWARKKGYD